MKKNVCLSVIFCQGLLPGSTSSSSPFLDSPYIPTTLVATTNYDHLLQDSQPPERDSLLVGFRTLVLLRTCPVPTLSAVFVAITPRERQLRKRSPFVKYPFKRGARGRLGPLPRVFFNVHFHRSSEKHIPWLDRSGGR